MSDPQRLSECSNDEIERSLLASARADAGSERALQRALAAFGGDTPPTSEGGASPTGSGGPMLVQWAGVGIAVTALVMVGTQLMRTGGDHSRPIDRPAAIAAPQVSREPARAESTSQAPAAVHEASSPRDELERLQPVTRPRSDAAQPRAAAPSQRATEAAPSAGAELPVPNAQTTPAAADAASSLAAEVRLLEQARAAIVARDPARGLQLLDRHAREFPTPALEPEAAVLRVEALAARGDWQRARLEAGRFLARHPNGGAARRIRELLAGAPIP